MSDETKEVIRRCAQIALMNNNSGEGGEIYKWLQREFPEVLGTWQNH